MRNLLRHSFARHGRFLFASAWLLAGFQFLICAAVSSLRLGAVLETVLRALPPPLQELLSSQLFGGFTQRGLLAFGWNHPVAHALGAAVVIVLAAAAVAGESETGAMELVLSQPVSRGAYFAVQIGFAFVAIFVVSASGVLGTMLGQKVFGMEPFAAGPLVRLGLNYAALQAAAYGITLLFSTRMRESGHVATVGFLIVLGSYFAQAIGRLWPKAAFVLPWTLHDHFSPQRILVGQAAITRPVAILAVVAAVCLILGWSRFRTQDLP